MTAKGQILCVYARGGPPPSYAIPKLAAVAEVHLLTVAPLPLAARPVAREHCVSIVDPSDQRLRGEALVAQIIATARAVDARAIITFSEFALTAVALACVRLNLPGPGPHAVRARDKRAMHSVWQRAGVPVTRSSPVGSVADLHAAWRALRPPLLLKSAWSAGQIGQLMLRREEDIPAAWQQARAAMARGTEYGLAELYADSTDGFVAEEIIRSSTESWFADPRYGDHVSVEGLVVAGRYRPVCVTGRSPTIEPFTERVNLTPCTLPEQAQRQIEQTASRAVDALGLDTCGTHTEMKLMPDGQVCMLETAARFGGVMVVREVESVHGVDLIGALVLALLGEDPGLPESMLVGPGRCAAGSISMLAADANGKPWQSLPEFRPERVDWRPLLSAGSRVEVVPDSALPSGRPVPAYDPANGFLNSAGVLFLESPDPEVLLHDAFAVMDGLENALRAASD